MAFPIDDDTFCSRLLAHGEPVDARAGYARFLAQRPQRAAWRPYAAGFALAATALLVAGFFFTPLGTLARSFATIFAPTQIEPVDVSSLPQHGRIDLDLRDLGTLQNQPMHVTKLASTANVDAVVGYHVLVPSYVPATLQPHPGFEVGRKMTNAFTFSAAKARAAEARLGKRIPEVPRALDGTKITVQFGPMVQQRWKGDEPALVIEQLPTPIVRSSGATLAELEKFVLALPGVSPQLAAQIRAIDDPASTLPVPFRSDKQSAQRIRIRGVDAIAIGDNTGVGAVVMWQSNHMLYVVAGPQREDEVVKVADGLR